ncbi:hypothetical protein [Halomicrobium salinisoli]|uniref:hypothetical protein n=1 Tax=Halomicrobium salinisoli TaxID=2878391 RepID=UPI001CF03523|nr:hypothetical protein [Halomicrobium salinisoli]
MFDSASTGRLENGLSGTGAFVYENSYWLVVISFLWTIGSLFVVTIGPVTLGAYVAIRNLDSDRNRVEPRRVLAVVRRQFVPATVFGLLPPLFLSISAGYLYSLSGGITAIRLGLGLATFYTGLYLSLVMMPTFVALADGQTGGEAVRTGVRWVAANPTIAMLVGLLTLGVLLVTVVFSVAFVLLYAGAAFSIQVRLVDDVGET